MKPKVLIFNGYYFPAKRYGGPATSVYNLIENCSDKLEFYLIVLNHDFGSKVVFSGISDGWNQQGSAQVMYVKDSDFTDRNICHWIKEIEPDVIYLSGILALRNFKYLMAARKLEIPVIIPPRGEICDNALKIKAYKKRPYVFLLRLFRVYHHVYFHTTSDIETEGLIKHLKIRQSQIFQIPNITRPIRSYAQGIHEKKQGKLNAVFLARICKTKNLYEALLAFKNIVGVVKFDIYGSIEDKDYWNQCQTLITELSQNVHVNYCGVVGPTEVCDIFATHDCFVFPTQTENFGHSIAEALCSGCPCIIPKGTTPWDDLGGRAGETYSLGDVDALSNIIQRYINMTDEEYNLISKQAIDYVTEKSKNREIAEQYIQMFSEVGNKNG